jgi:hypothetical protein
MSLSQRLETKTAIMVSVLPVPVGMTMVAGSMVVAQWALIA